ncbi:MAG TPA: rod shape-determining protein MreC [Candidatus Paceibacterota bacterium]|nr:rod shape-determining protein MreC [Candidatus Paceibacterota bacterium]
MKETITIILILIIVLIVLNFIPGLNKGLGNFVYKIFSPIGRFFSNIGNGISGFFRIIFSIGDLNEENLVLKQENLVLEAENSTLIEVKRENDILKEALNISKSEQQIKEVASVVGKDIQGIQDWILINKGSKHGIIKDMIAISPENALVGKISEVNPSFSKITLIIQKDSVVAGIIEKNRIEGLVKRDDKGGLFIDFIPKNENLEINERIITSGMDNLYPKGILIGKIENIDTSDNQIFKKIIITPAVDFSKLENVFIIK